MTMNRKRLVELAEMTNDMVFVESIHKMIRVLDSDRIKGNQVKYEATCRILCRAVAGAIEWPVDQVMKEVL